MLHTHCKFIRSSPRLDVSMQCTTIIKATGKGNRSQVFCLLELKLQQWLDAGMTVKYQWLYGYLNCHSDRSHILLCCLEGIKEIKADMTTFFNIWQHFFCKPHSRVDTLNVKSICMLLLNTSSFVF